MNDNCYKCLCDECLNNVDNMLIRKGNIACLNCDECYYYGCDDNSKSKNVKHKCDDFCTDKPKMKLLK